MLRNLFVFLPVIGKGPRRITLVIGRTYKGNDTVCVNAVGICRSRDSVRQYDMQDPYAVFTVLLVYVRTGFHCE